MTTENALTRLASEVRTLARPASGSLLAARGLVQRDASLQAAFLTAKAEGWSADKLADALCPTFQEQLEGEAAELREAALYLSDEFLQDGEGILLVSRETGKVLARITEEDVWQPAPVKREDGTLVKPLPRLRPDLEGFLLQWTFDRSRESDALATLTATQAQTSMAKVITHEGRKGIVERLRANADQLLAGVKGNARDFLDAFDADGTGGFTLEDGPPSWATPLPRATAFVRTSMGLADFKSLNLRFDVLTHQQSVIGTQWVIEMARTLALACPDIRDIDEVTPEDIDEATFWAGPAAVVEECRRQDWPYLALDGDLAVGLRGSVGVLEVHSDTYRVASREVLDRWEVVASVEYTLWVDWSKAVGLRLPREATVTVLD